MLWVKNTEWVKRYRNTLKSYRSKYRSIPEYIERTSEYRPFCRKIKISLQKIPLKWMEKKNEEQKLLVNGPHSRCHLHFAGLCYDVSGHLLIFLQFHSLASLVFLCCFVLWLSLQLTCSFSFYFVWFNLILCVWHHPWRVKLKILKCVNKFESSSIPLISTALLSVHVSFFLKL